jgi:hypothetical protein
LKIRNLFFRRLVNLFNFPIYVGKGFFVNLLLQVAIFVRRLGLLFGYLGDGLFLDPRIRFFG